MTHVAEWPCRFCGRRVRATQEQMATNPFCSTCIPARIAIARSSAEPVVTTEIDDYVRFIPLRAGETPS